MGVSTLIYLGYQTLKTKWIYMTETILDLIVNICDNIPIDLSGHSTINILWLRSYDLNCISHTVNIISVTLTHNK